MYICIVTRREDFVYLRLPVPNALPDGTAVKVEAIEAPSKPAKRSLLDRLGDVVGKVEGLPADASQNVDHYLYGHPKK